MAITKISPEERGNYHSFGESLGKYVGGGITNAAEGLAQAKLNHLISKQDKQNQWHEREEIHNQLVAGGFPTELARIIASQRPEDRIKTMQLFGGGREPIGSQNNVPVQQGQPQTGGIQQLLNNNNGLPQQGGSQDAIIQNLLKILGPQQQQEYVQNQQPGQQPSNQQQPKLNAYQLAGAYETPQIRQARLKMEQQERQFQQKESREERKLNHAEQNKIDKETLPFYNKINADAKSARANNDRLGRMEKLVNEGKLVGSKFAGFLEGLEKLPVLGGAAASIAKSFLYNPESREFEKLTFDFLKDAKSVFGSRLTNYDVESFLKTVPTLVLNPEGKRRVIRNLKLFNEGTEVRQKALKQILKQTGGVRPRNLEGLVEEYASKDLDRISEEFKTGTPSA